MISYQGFLKLLTKFIMTKYLYNGHLDPEKVVRRNIVRATIVSSGKSSWPREVGGSDPRNELEDVAAECGLEIVYHVPLPPAADQIRPSKSFIMRFDIIHIGLFVGSAADVWSIDTFLDRVQTMVSSAWKRNNKYRKAHGFWFVISIWYSADRYWAVIALDINSSLPDQSSSVLPAYNVIMHRVRNGVDHDDNSASARAVLVIVHDGKISRCQIFDSIEHATRRVGNVHVISSGGPLEAIWIARHPRSFMGLRVCRTLQENPNSSFTIRNLARVSDCSSSTTHSVVSELASMGAPVYRQSEFEWIFRPID